MTTFGGYSPCGVEHDSFMKHADKWDGSLDGGVDLLGAKGTLHDPSAAQIIYRLNASCVFGRADVTLSLVCAAPLKVHMCVPFGASRVTNTPFPPNAEGLTAIPLRGFPVERKPL
jgi:hypothetical protein